MTGPAPDRVLNRLPAHLVARDAEAGGVLHALLGAVAGELTVLEDDLEDLYDGWFVETCAEWLLPYLGDLIGLTDLPPDLGPGTSRRALVANTIAYRRRKGTVAVLERVAADVSGWPARAVEYYQHLVASTHLDHVRLDRPATASVRDAAGVQQVASAHAAAGTLTPGLDTVAHTAEVRGIASGRGRYGVPAIGVFLYPLRVNEVGRHGGRPRATASDDGSWTADPLGRAIPLFVPPSGAAELPVPVSPRALLAMLQEARAGLRPPTAVPVGVSIDGVEIEPASLRVTGLEDPEPPTADRPQVAVDPTTGRLTVRGGRPDPDVSVRYAYGAAADVGAGTYDRTAVHAQVLASDRYDGRPDAAAQVAVLSGTAATPTTVGSLGAAVTRLASAPGGSQVIAIGDNARYEEDVVLRVPEGARMVVVAATWPAESAAAGLVGFYLPDGLRPHVRGTLRIEGGPGSSVVLDGILLDGDLDIAPGRLGSLTVSQSTVAGRIGMSGPDRSDGDLRLRVVRSVIGGIELGPVVPGLSVTDSVVDGALCRTGPAAGTAVVSAPTAHAAFDGSTVRGAVAVRSIDASSCVFDGPLAIAHRQTGSVRYSYTRPGSPTPRRFRCVPAEALAAGPVPAPVYASTRPGAPDHLALSTACPPEIRTGGEHDAEMGVHHHLRRPLRAAAVARQLAQYAPVGREIGIFGS